MYERLLDKTSQPTDAQYAAYIGDTLPLFNEANGFLVTTLGCSRMMRFPYGNKYGWGYKYSIKSKHICDVFAEKDAFMVMVRATNVELARVYDAVSQKTQKAIDARYPCGEGGWVYCRVTTRDDVSDVITLLKAKLHI